MDYKQTCDVFYLHLCFIDALSQSQNSMPVNQLNYLRMTLVEANFRRLLGCSDICASVVNTVTSANIVVVLVGGGGDDRAKLADNSTL